MDENTKKFGAATLHTTKFRALRGMELLGKIMRAVPANADEKLGIASAVISDPRLSLELLANTFAIYQPASAAEPQRLELGRAEFVDVVFGDNVKDLFDAVSWVLDYNFHSFRAGGSPGASASPAPSA